MTNDFALREMTLVSRLEKRGRTLRFDPVATVIKGTNDTGKSSIIKSIFGAFGAEPFRAHERWRRAAVTILVRFSVGNSVFAILRQGKSFSLFDEKDQLLGSYQSVTKELAPRLAEIFRFGLLLQDHSLDSRVPPPAFLFLPFYLDQEGGWIQNWNSFAKLSQFRNWKRPVVSYHTGIRPNEWYALKSRSRVLESERAERARQLATLEALLERLSSQLERVRFDVDIGAYKQEVDGLLRHCQALKSREEQYRDRLVELETERIRLQAQREIVTAARQELASDFEYASHRLDDDVDCPTCGATYANSFAERFGIANDEDRCVGLLEQLRDDLITNEARVREHRQTVDETALEVSSVSRALAEKQGEITLRDVIQAQGKREVAGELRSQLDQLMLEVADLDRAMEGINEKVKKLENRKRANEVGGTYRSLMRRHLRELSVDSLSEDSYKNLHSVIKETGSDLPRAILGYFFSILHLVREHSTASFCPIVIDSPNQQEQDSDNHLRVLEFIRDHRPEGSQLVLGLVEDLEVDFGGRVVELTEKDFALSEGSYLGCLEVISPYEEASLKLE